MKNLSFSSLLFLAAPLCLASTSAHASILSPTDIVLYNEKDPQNNLIGIKKLQDGTEWITQAACDKDVWIGTLADETAHCHSATPILRVSDFSKMVEIIVAKIASENPDTALAPLPPADLAAYAQSLKVQSDPANTTALQQLSGFKAELKNVNAMLVHLPDNPDYLDRKKTAETEVAKLAELDQKISEAQNQQAKIDSELLQLSESMLNLIRYKKLKNPQAPVSPLNPETEEPNSLGKSQMAGTLLKAVFEHLTESTTMVNFQGDQYHLGGVSVGAPVGGINLYHINNSISYICGNCSEPYLFTDGILLYSFMTENISGETRLSVYIYSTSASNERMSYLSTFSEDFTKVMNVSTDLNGKLQIMAITKDGRMWQKAFTLDDLKSDSSGNWTELK